MLTIHQDVNDVMIHGLRSIAAVLYDDGEACDSVSFVLSNKLLENCQPFRQQRFCETYLD